MDCNATGRFLVAQLVMVVLVQPLLTFVEACVKGILLRGELYEEGILINQLVITL